MTTTHPGERRDLACGDCGARMQLKPSKHGLFYGCTTFPMCRGTHGAHPDGAPLGQPADKTTKAARVRVHAAFDRLWQGGHMPRAVAYGWLQGRLGLVSGEAHIGRFDLVTCERVVALVEAHLATLAADEATPAQLRLREVLGCLFGTNKGGRKRARTWLAKVLGMGDTVTVHSLTRAQCEVALTAIDGMTAES
jgi:ssDNA-binding Zn-finger/Zn-ribbon topoisomerase 1